MDSNDTELLVLLAAAGPCSLDESPKKNWVERSGGLPNYICHIAKGVMKSGKSRSQAIAIAVSRVKKWAAGGDDVDADTRAKAAKAVAQWEKLKTKNAAKKLSLAMRDDYSEYILLSNISSFNTETVRRAWETREREQRQAYEAAHPSSRDIAAPSSALYPYRWIRELWTDFIIVECEFRDGMAYQKIPYTVSGNDVTFGEPDPVVQKWVEAPNDELNSIERRLLADVLVAKVG